VQVFEVGTASMMAAKGAIYPVYQLMADAGEPFDPKGFLQAVTGYYTDPDGNMLSMPFNSSTPILYFNKNASSSPDSQNLENKQCILNQTLRMRPGNRCDLGQEKPSS
jgi:hypothetical protein